MAATISTVNNPVKPKKAIPWWRSWPALLGAAVVLLGIVGVGLSGMAGEESLGAQGPIYVAKPGPLTISVSESGTIQAREQVVLKNEVEGQTTIIWIIDEGTHVKKGDLLVELDASQLQDNLVDQQIRVQNADAAAVRARETLAITKSKGESDVAQAQLDYEFAQEDLKKYVQGEYPKELNELEAKIKLAEGDLEDAQNTADWSQKLYDRKYIAKSDLTRDQLQLERAKLDVETAKADKALLKDYTYERTVREYQSNVEQTKMALDRVQRQAKANVVQDDADLNAKQSELNRQKERQAKIEDQITKTKIYSPADGMVIYATTGQDNRRGNDEPLEAGRVVREREELIYLPTANSKLVNIKIHESSLKKVKVGQPVRITINALPGKEYSGRVTRIAPLPDAQSFWRGNPDVKVYNTEIYLDGNLEGVRTGMTCKAEIIVQQLNNVISVPVQCVVKVDSQPTVYVQRGGKVVPVSVKLGMDNKDRVHIVSGLSDGDRVLTDPPLDHASMSMPGAEQAPAATEDGKDTSQNSGASPSPASNPPPPAAGAEQPQANNGPQPGGRPEMTPEQREQMRQRFQNMTPEQREAFRQRMQQQGGGPRGNRPGGGPGGGGQGGGQGGQPQQQDQQK